MYLLFLGKSLAGLTGFLEGKVPLAVDIYRIEHKLHGLCRLALPDGSKGILVRKVIVPFSGESAVIKLVRIHGKRLEP